MLVVAGTGAALTGLRARARQSARAAWPRGLPRRRGGALAFVFASGRYGADVGAAIVLPLGAAVAAALLARPPRAWRCSRFAIADPGPGAARRWRTCSAAPTPTSPARCSTPQRRRRADVARRRLQQSAHSFARPILLVFLPRGRSPSLSSPGSGASGSPPGCTAVPRCAPASPARSRRPLVGTLANDSGALLLEIGSRLSARLRSAIAWAESGARMQTRDIVYP